MRLEIKGLSAIRERLARAQIETVAARALAAGAEQMAEAVKAGLVATPGGAHDRPWLRTGALNDSIGAHSEGLAASVGSNDSAAAPQELGTSRLPPRPFLAPVAATMGEPIAQSIGQAVTAVLKGEVADNPVILVSNSMTGRQQSMGAPFAFETPGSPENEALVQNVMRRLKALGHILHSDGNNDDVKPDAATPELDKTGNATLPEDRRNYILDGDGKGGGGHGPGRTTPGKSTFPSDWSDDKAIEAIVGIANDPASNREPGARGRTVVNGTRDGIDIKVVIGADGKTIINGFPTNVPRN